MTAMKERFSTNELTALRSDLLQGGLIDSREAAELLQVFLMGRGYGVSPQAAVATARAAQMRRDEMRDMSSSLFRCRSERRRGPMVALRRWRHLHPRRCRQRRRAERAVRCDKVGISFCRAAGDGAVQPSALPLLWQRRNSPCRRLNAPQICRVADAVAKSVLLFFGTR